MRLAVTVPVPSIVSAVEESEEPRILIQFELELHHDEYA